jgi:hypothetical protein
MQTHGDMEVKLYIFLTFTVDKSADLTLATFSMGQHTPSIHSTVGWVRPRDSPDAMAKSKICVKAIPDTSTPD